MCKRGLTADAHRINYRGNDEGTSVILRPGDLGPPSRLVITVIIYSDSIVVIELSRGASHSYRIIINPVLSVYTESRIEIEETSISLISRAKIAFPLVGKESLKTKSHPSAYVNSYFLHARIAREGRDSLMSREYRGLEKVSPCLSIVAKRSVGVTRVRDRDARRQPRGQNGTRPFDVGRIEASYFRSTTTTTTTLLPV